MRAAERAKKKERIPGEWKVVASLKGRPPACLVNCRTSTLRELKTERICEKLERKGRCKNETS